MEQLASLIAASINSGTPLLLAAIGLLINERAGVLNLGAEGMMLVSAIAGFAVGYTTHSALLGFAAGAICGMLLSTLFAWLALLLATNQVATGLALSIFGAGLSAFVGQHFVDLWPAFDGHRVAPGFSEPVVVFGEFVRQGFRLKCKIAHDAVVIDDHGEVRRRRDEKCGGISVDSG